MTGPVLVLQLAAGVVGIATLPFLALLGLVAVVLHRRDRQVS